MSSPWWWGRAVKVSSRAIWRDSFRRVSSHSLMFGIFSMVSIWRSIMRRWNIDMRFSSCAYLSTPKRQHLKKYLKSITHAVLSLRVLHPGSPLGKLSNRLCTRLLIKGVGTSKSPPYESNLDLIVTLPGLGLSSPPCSGLLPGNWIELVAIVARLPSTDTGTVIGNSMGILDPGASGESSLLAL